MKNGVWFRWRGLLLCLSLVLLILSLSIYLINNSDYFNGMIISFSIVISSIVLVLCIYFRRSPKRSTEISATGRLTRSLTIMMGVVLFILIIMLPLTSVFKFAFEDGMSSFWNAVTSKEALNAFKNSLLVALIATGINLFVGTAISMAITRYKFPGRAAFRALIDLPIAIPTAVVGLSLMMLYGPMGLIGPMLNNSGIEVVMALPGVILAHIFVTFPFMIRSISVVLQKMERNLEESAMTLGAGKTRIFWSVILPSIRSGMIAGSALTFTRSLGEFGATLFVAGGVMATGPLYIAQLNEDIQFQEACSISIVLMVVPFVLLLCLNAIVDRMEDV